MKTCYHITAKDDKTLFAGGILLLCLLTLSGTIIFTGRQQKALEIYSNPDYIEMASAGIGRDPAMGHDKVSKGLVVDLDADSAVVTDGHKRVEKWINQAGKFPVMAFVKQDKGRKEEGSGRPLLVEHLPALNGHNTISFNKQELVAADEDAFDHLITGSGYTWFCVLKPGRQSGELENVNSFFGSLKNGGYYEGFWAGFNDDNSIWMGSRNGKSFGRWDANNPNIATNKVLSAGQYYLVAGRMDAGTDTVNISLYVNNCTTPVSTGRFPVNINANASKLAIGQERDAVEHPGRESFIGEISRFLLYERALTQEEMKVVGESLRDYYQLKQGK
ncbi:LamG-like jellyroll fold domain-containing protein [Chitinophaga sp. 22321]|uniref:Concanavalin A-like lectin/glucanases superfamily protein n=1 Tax=Chitinophaga hostae TaxID=2831022 RepID=A0ABS5J6X3_9BACT|nr:LamG-like jellyroll fold domain-containing protein [Chitinophaga hostae]MBS0030969.1 hypothetical protein [Chitinophaga hostae]